MEDTILLEEGDTLELVTGHVTTGKPSRSLAVSNQNFCLWLFLVETFYLKLLS